MKRTLFVICFLASAILFMPSAEAAPITFNFTGSFNSQTGLAAFNFTGATITGSYTFESATLDSPNVPDAIGTYTGAVTNLSGNVTAGFTSPAFLFGATGGNITVWNELDPNNKDAYSVATGGSANGNYDTDLPGYTLQAFRLDMLSSNPIANPDLNSDALPSLPPWFDTPTSTLNFGTGGKADFLLTSLTVTSVPEPSTILLLVSGLAGLVGFSRRRLKK